MHILVLPALAGALLLLSLRSSPRRPHRVRPAPLLLFTCAAGRYGFPTACRDWTACTPLAVVELPLHLNWSAPGRVFDLRSRADRARVYETVLQEGRPADILAYVDGALLVDLWDELVLPRAVRSAWAPLVTPSATAA